MMHLDSLVQVADSLKYSCHASSILDTDDLADQVADIALSNNKVGHFSWLKYNIFYGLVNNSF